MYVRKIPYDEGPIMLLLMARFSADLFAPSRAAIAGDAEEALKIKCDG